MLEQKTMETKSPSKTPEEIKGKQDDSQSTGE